MLTDVKALCRWALHALTACIFVLVFSGAAAAQNLTCPLTSNLNTNSGVVRNVASVCLIGYGLELDTTYGDLNNEGPNGNDGTILNEGTINNAVAIVQTYCPFSGCQPNSTQNTVYNALGTVFNSGGIYDGVVLNTGLIENETGGILSNVRLTNALGGTITNYGSLTGTLTNGGTIYNLGGSIELTGLSSTNTNNGTIQNFSGGSITVDAGTSLTNNATIFNNLGGTITNSGNLTNSLGATITNDGSFGGAGSFANNGTFNNTGGAGLLSLDSSGQITNERGGAMDVGSGTGPPSVNTGSVINNGFLGISGLNNFGQLQNNGTLSVGVGFLALEPGVNVVNNGSILIDGFSGQGGIIIGVASTLTNAAGSSFQQVDGNTSVYGTLNSVPAVQLQGGTILGTGTVTGDVNNSGGTVQPGVQPTNVGGFVPGTLTINGNYTQGSAGGLDIELLSDAPDGFGLLDVSCLVTLDGTVDFFAYPGFDPQVGEDFTFLLGGSISGEFASLDAEGWSCPIEDTCFVVYGAHSVSLDIDAATSGERGRIESREVVGGGGGAATPEPSTLALLALAIIPFVAVSWRNRRAEVESTPA